MTGPFVDILKNVAVNRLQVGFVKIAFRAIALSKFPPSARRSRDTLSRAARNGFQFPICFSERSSGLVVRRVGIGVGTLGALISQGEAQQKAASSQRAASALEG